jgi:Zn-dependent protease with chaperone function
VFADVAFLRAIALAVVLSTVACASGRDYVTGRVTLNHYSIAEDIDLGTRHATLLLASSEAQGYVVDPSDIYTQTVRVVAARILAVPENRARMPPFPWEVHTLGFGQANAWCFAGGQILVLAGLMAKGVVRDENELAAIIGHEMAHAAARHATERMTVERFRKFSRPFGRFLGPRLMSLLASPHPSQVIATLSKSSERFDQDQELEADLYGLEFMARAGYDPRSALNIWRRLADRTHDVEGSGIGATHPSYADRLTQLKQHLPVVDWIVNERTTHAPDWLSKTDWKYIPPSLSATVTQTQCAEQGVLPSGARIGAQYLRGVDRLLKLKVKLMTSVLGEAPRIEVRLHAGQDLVENQIPFTAVLITERVHSTSQTEIDGSYLARQSKLTKSETVMRLAIPRYPPGRYRLIVRASVGSLLSESTLRYDVLDL